MMPALKQLADRVDALGLRQRVMIFCAFALVLVLVTHKVLIEPLRARETRMAAEMKQQQADMKPVQDQLKRIVEGNAVDPDAVNRSRRAALLHELRQLNARIVQEQRRFTPPEQMRRVLEELLEKNRRLALVDLKTLPVVAVAGPRAGFGGGGMYKHGMELTVRGSYGELYEYLRGLENLPHSLYWARAELSVQAHPALILKLTVHTLSFDRAWLVV